MGDHIMKTSSAAFYYLYNIRGKRKYLSKECTATLIHAFISSRLDYCNSLLYSLPAYQVQFSIKNDSDSSDFGDSDSDKEQTIDDNIYGYPNDVEGRNFAENEEDNESVGSDFDSDDNQNVYMNEVSEIAFINEHTVGQVLISNERDDASTDTSTTSNPPRPWKRRRVTTGTQNQARCLQQQPQFIWNQNNPNNTVPEFHLRPGPTRVWGGESSPTICFQLFWDDALFEFLIKMQKKRELIILTSISLHGDQ